VSDVLIRDVRDDELAALDALAARQGLSRTEYIRRRQAQDARTARVSVTNEDLRRFADTFSALGGAAAMDKAWE
jgi:Ribbon-helix-helix protein, copG family